MHLSNHWAPRLCRLMFTALMGAAWCNVRLAGAAPAAEPDRRQGAEAMDRLLRMVEAADRDGPRETFDVQAVVRGAGQDPVKVFEWVRDRTWWVPYRGALRGPTGVLMDRVGGSLDRALLLAEMLRTAHRQVRLVHATLSPEQAKALVAKVRPVADDWAAVRQPESDEAVEARLVKYAAQFGVDEQRLRASTRRVSLRGSRLAEDLAARVAEQAPSLMKAIEGVAETAGAPAPDERQAIEAAQDHWWVSYEQDGAWVDADPMLPDARVGTRAVEPAGEAREYVGVLPNEPGLCHEVQIEVKVGRWTPRGLEEATALKHTLRPADVLGTRVALTHLPLSWPTDVNLLKEKDPAAKLRELAIAQHEWAPVLQVGANTVIQSSFDDAGKVNTNPALVPMKKTGAAAGGAAKSAFDVLNDAPPTQAPKPDGQLVAEWIDYEIRSPGRPAVRVRRQLFDLLAGGPPAGGTAAFPLNIPEDQQVERALSPLGDTEIFLQPCAVSAAFVDHLAMQGALANRRTLQAVISREELDADFANEQIGGAVTPAGEVYSLALARGLHSPVGARVYLDSPNVVSRHQSLRLGRAVGGLSLLVCEGFDIVANPVAVRRGAPGDATAPAERMIRLQQGVADTVAEALLSGDCGKLENASELYAASAGKGEQWVTLRKGAGPSPASLALPPEARARIERDLEAGHVVVAPAKAGSAEGAGVAWWRVDPRTGQTLGITRQGWGGAVTAEDVASFRVVLKAALMFKCIGSALGGANPTGGVTMCAMAGILGAAGLAGGLGGGILSAAADLFSLFK
jgi:hypothetical protein